MLVIRHADHARKAVRAAARVGNIKLLQPQHPRGTAPYASSYTPSQLRAAYGFDQISIPGITADGAGQTVAIVDAYDNPNFVSTGSANFANSDLHKFDVAFGLQDPPSFLKVNQTG